MVQLPLSKDYTLIQESIWVKPSVITCAVIWRCSRNGIPKQFFVFVQSHSMRQLDLVGNILSEIGIL